MHRSAEEALRLFAAHARHRLLRADMELVGTRPPVGNCQAKARPVAQESRQGRGVPQASSPDAVMLG
jgi:hypothetical protein